MGDTDNAAEEVLRRIVAAPEPNLWPLGSWLQNEGLRRSCGIRWVT